MQLLQVFFLITVLLCFIESREYHYDRPALPFHDNIATNEIHSPANTLNYRQFASTQGGNVIQNSGPSATNYEIYNLARSNQIFQGTAKLQPAAVTYQSASSHVNYNLAPINRQVPQQVHLQHGTSNAYTYPSLTQAYVAGAPNAPNYIQQGPQQQVGQYAAPAGQSTLVNPFNGAAINFAQSAPQYRAPPAQLIATPQPVFNSAFGTPKQGNYVSQSESGHLDVYPHKQQGGDPRTYKRVITTCYPNGQCELLQLNAGPTDPSQNNVVWSTRAYTAPVPDKCRRIAEAKRQAASAETRTTGTFVQPNNGPYVAALIRPPNRRLFPYSEIVVPRDAYNK